MNIEYDHYDYQDGDKWEVTYFDSQKDFRLTLGGDDGLTIDVIPPDVLVDLYFALGHALKQHLIEYGLSGCGRDALHQWAAKGLDHHYDQTPDALREGWKEIVEEPDEDDPWLQTYLSGPVS